MMEFSLVKLKYIMEMLKRFEMEKLKPMNIPMSSSIKLDKDDQGTSIDITKYLQKT